MCDGCPHSYHMSCLKLTIEPDEEKWFCPDCNPTAFNTEEIRRLGRGAAVPRSGDAANSSTCYVCQRPGKLLGCDFCVNSFHPSCLVDVDWNAIGEEWECPVCKGFDPLANQMHKRWTRHEIETKRKERAKNYEKYRSKVMRYRNRFLVVHQKDLGPFVNPKILQALARTLKGKEPYACCCNSSCCCCFVLLLYAAGLVFVDFLCEVGVRRSAFVSVSLPGVVCVHPPLAEVYSHVFRVFVLFFLQQT